MSALNYGPTWPQGVRPWCPARRLNSWSKPRMHPKDQPIGGPDSFPQCKNVSRFAGRFSDSTGCNSINVLTGSFRESGRLFFGLRLVEPGDLRPLNPGQPRVRQIRNVKLEVRCDLARSSSTQPSSVGRSSMLEAFFVGSVQLAGARRFDPPQVRPQACRTGPQPNRDRSRPNNARSSGPGRRGPERHGAGTPLVIWAEKGLKASTR